MMDRRVEERPRFGVLQRHRHCRDPLAEIHVFVGGLVEAAGGGGESDTPRAQDRPLSAARATRRCLRPPETLVSFGAGICSVSSRNSPPTVSVTRIITAV